jgi:hypothetical protein
MRCTPASPTNGASTRTQSSGIQTASGSHQRRVCRQLDGLIGGPTEPTGGPPDSGWSTLVLPLPREWPYFATRNVVDIFATSRRRLQGQAECRGVSMGGVPSLNSRVSLSHHSPDSRRFRPHPASQTLHVSRRARRVCALRIGAADSPPAPAGSSSGIPWPAYTRRLLSAPSLA